MNVKFTKSPYNAPGILVIIHNKGVDTMPLTEAQRRAKAKYNEKVIKVQIELYPQDADIIDKLKEQPSKQAYIKELIRKDIR